MEVYTVYNMYSAVRNGLTKEGGLLYRVFDSMVEGQ